MGPAQRKEPAPPRPAPSPMRAAPWVATAAPLHGPFRQRSQRSYGQRRPRCRRRRRLRRSGSRFLRTPQ
eukprot:4578313-Prymnesium_polylepis.1